MDKIKRINEILDYRLPSRLSSKGIKVKYLLIIVIIGLILTILLTTAPDQSLYSISVSEDGSMCAYVVDGYVVPQTLRVSNADGTLMFEHEFTDKETAGGVTVVWFEDENICTYSFRTDRRMDFSKDGTIKSTATDSDFDYPNQYEGFSKGFSEYSYKTEQGEYKYVNADFFSSLLLRRPKELLFVDQSGNECLLWKGN